MVRKVARIRNRALVGVMRNGQRETAYLRDYSSEGVCLDGMRSVMAGDVLRLHCKGALISAEVRWVREGRAGLCYLPSCAPSEKSRFLSAISRRQRPSDRARIYGFSELA